METPQPRSRFTIAGILLLVILLGLGSRAFSDQLPAWITHHAGDALWTVAVYLSLAWIFVRWSPIRLAAVAFAISIAVELSQLIDVQWLNALRATLPGKLLLGAGFLWMDLLRYFGGALVAMTTEILWLRQRDSKPPAT